MENRISREKSKLKLNMVKELAYALLLITFFVGIVLGSLNFKNVDDTSFNEYTDILNENISKINTGNLLNHDKMFYSGLKSIFICWIIGLSSYGVPVLIFYLGYKGYSIGYTISTIIKLLGIKTGNGFIFKYLFFKNVFLIFIMIFLINFSIKNFSDDIDNIKSKSLKYTAITALLSLLWLGVNLAQKMFFVNF